MTGVLAAGEGAALAGLITYFLILLIPVLLCIFSGRLLFLFSAGVTASRTWHGYISPFVHGTLLKSNQHIDSFRVSGSCFFGAINYFCLWLHFAIELCTI